MSGILSGTVVGGSAGSALGPGTRRQHVATRRERGVRRFAHRRTGRAASAWHRARTADAPVPGRTGRSGGEGRGASGRGPFAVLARRAAMGRLCGAGGRMGDVAERAGHQRLVPVPVCGELPPGTPGSPRCALVRRRRLEPDPARAELALGVRAPLPGGAGHRGPSLPAQVGPTTAARGVRLARC